LVQGIDLLESMLGRALDGDLENDVNSEESKLLSQIETIVSDCLVDLPPEEDLPLREAYAPHELASIRLATPTTTTTRMKTIADGASGFLYYVAVTGITGAKRATAADIADGVAMARRMSGLPVCIGFGVKTGAHAADMATIADGVVVGSAFVEHAGKAATSGQFDEAALGMGALAKELSEALKGTRL
jgi:tryptophan synthase alpha chain